MSLHIKEQILPVEVCIVHLHHTEVRTLLVLDTPLDWWSAHCLCEAHSGF